MITQLDTGVNFGFVIVDGYYHALDTIINLSTGQGSFLKDPAVYGPYNAAYLQYPIFSDITTDVTREIVRIIAVSGDTVTMLRAQENTAATDKISSVGGYALVVVATEKLIDDANTILGELFNITTLQSASIVDLQSQVGSQSVKIGIIGGEITDIYNQLQFQSSSIVALQVQTGSQSVEIGSINNEVTDIYGQLQTQSSSITTLNNSTELLFNDVNNLNYEYQVQSSSIVTLNNEYQVQSSSITTLNNEVTDIYGQLQTQSSSIVTLNNEYQVQSSSIAIINEEIPLIAEQLGVIDGQINTLSGQVQTQSASINVIQQQIPQIASASVPIGGTTGQALVKTNNNDYVTQWETLTPAVIGSPAGSGNSNGTNTGDQTIMLAGAISGSGTGSILTTLATSSVVPGAYTNSNITVDSHGLITSATSGTIPMSAITLTGAVIGSGTGSIVTTLATSSVIPGSYNNASFTVNAAGLLTAASSGTGSITTDVMIQMSSTQPSAIPNTGQLFVGEESVGGIDGYVVACFSFDTAQYPGPGGHIQYDVTGQHFIWNGFQSSYSSGYTLTTGYFTEGIIAQNTWVTSTYTSGEHDWDWVGDYTLDWWMNLSSTPPVYQSVPVMDPLLMNYYADSTLQNYWQMDINYNTNVLTFKIDQASLAGSPYLQVNIGTGYYNSWHHYAYVKYGHTITLFIDGVAVGNAPFTGMPTQYPDTGRGPYYSSYYGLNLCGNGNVGANLVYDEIRFSKGIARWTSNFTPPLAPYVTTETFASSLYYMDGFGVEYNLSAAASLTVTNIGTGSNVYAGEVNNTFQFKAIAAGTGMSILDNGNTLTLSASAQTASVTSVNGQSGSVVLTTTNIAEGTNLYYTAARGSASVNTVLTAIEGVPNGIATLNGSGQVPSSQLPSMSSALTVQGSGSGGSGVSVTNVNDINFDYTTGLRVSQVGSNGVLVSLGSAFQTINNPLGSNLAASGEDTYSNLASASIQITGNNTPGSKSVAFTLVNDAVSPGATQYYGTNGAGTKGFYTLSTGSVPLVIQYNSSSMPTEPALNFTGNVLVTDNPGSASVVNILGAGSSLTYYFQNTSSSVVGDKSMIITPYTPKTSLVYSNVVSGTNFQSFITSPGVPNLTFIPAGQFEFHVHASATGGTAYLYGEAWETDATGSVIGLICTGEVSNKLTSSELEYELYAVTPNTYNMRSSASRILCQLYATTTSLPNITVYVGDEADSHLLLPSVTVDASTFIPYAGATADINLGSHNLVTSGSASVSNIIITNGASNGLVWTASGSTGSGSWQSPSTSGLTLTGAVTGSGTGSVTTTLATSGVSAGTYTNPIITVSAGGVVTAAANGAAGSGSLALSANTTVNLTSSMSAATIQTYINAQPRNLNGYSLTFQFGNGTYTLASQLTFSNFYGGQLNIYGNTAETNATTLHTTQNVVLQCSASGGNTSCLYLNNCYCYIQIYDIAMQFVNAAATYGVYINNCFSVAFYYNYIYGSTTSGNAGSGLFTVISNVDAELNYFANYKNAIYAYQQSLVYSYDNQTTGSGTTTYGLVANYASTIARSSTQPTGGTGATSTTVGTIL